MPANANKKVLITGANGFIGQFLGHYLLENDYHLVHALRSPKSIQQALAAGQLQYIGNIDAHTDWSQALKAVDIVVHLAARVHVMAETAANPLLAFEQTNYHGTINLAKQAISAGVKRFIYLSSIKVNGEQTKEQPFCADDPAVTLDDPYALSKQQAELALLDLQQQGLLEVVIIRPPLVYGAGVKGNFLRLIQLAEKQLPLPLKQIKNQRSLVSVNNLCSLIQCGMEHPKASGQVFLVSDGRDISSSELLAQISQALQCKNRLFYLPRGLLQVLTSAIGKSQEFQRLFDSLQVDIDKNRQLLNWQPQTSMQSALQQTINFYQKEQAE